MLVTLRQFCHNGTLMNTRFFPGLLLCLTTVCISTKEAPAADNPGGWDAAVWEKLLRSSPPKAQVLRAGDMILPRKYVEHTLKWLKGGRIEPDEAFQGDVTLWPGGIVYYSFASDITALHRKAFTDACADWSTFANVTFVQRTNQPNYLFVQNSSGNSSGVGMLGGPQDFFMNAWVRGTLTHELGHALGLVHEHQRSDRDSFVTILTQNIEPGDEFAFALLLDSNNVTSYDFLSTMHYSRNAFSIEPDLDTIEPLPAYMQYIDVMGNDYGLELSTNDRQGMASVYGTGPTISSVVTNTKDSGVGSLRAAIFYAQDHPGTTVTFNIPPNDPGHIGSVYIIKPTDVMTAPVNGTIIDGTTQPNGNSRGPSITIDGSQWPAPTYPMPGFLLKDINCTVKSMSFINGSSDGIEIDGPNSTGNTVVGCYVGLNSNGSAVAPNAYAGIGFSNGAHNNIIGGTTSALRNVISGNLVSGIYVNNATANVVLGNYLGTDRTGGVAVPNGYAGVWLDVGSVSNTIGGTTAGTRNVLSGNSVGVSITATGVGQNVIAGNYIGVNATGTAALPNSGDGVSIFVGAQQNTIGGSVSGAKNVISGNGGNGVTISDSGTTGNVVTANFIGINAAGTAALPNAFNGVGIYNGAQSNTIGGTTVSKRNVVSGNTYDGISLADSGTNLNNVQGNVIGLNAAGTGAIPNGFRGVTMANGAQSNTVGGTIAGAGNTISGNTYEGIDLFDTGTTHNSFRQNSIHDNGDLGIRLSTDNGGTPNDLQAAPHLLSAVIGTGNITIRGSLTSTPNTIFTVEFFANSTADPSGFGEGQTFLGTTQVRTNASGTGNINKVLSVTVQSGYAVSSTATSPLGSTSEFSNDVTAH
jgi:hypothetical protein